MTTLNNYGKIVLEVQGQLVRKKCKPTGLPLTADMLEEILAKRGL